MWTAQRGWGILRGLIFVVVWRLIVWTGQFLSCEFCHYYSGFIKHVYGHGYEHECEGVGRGGDDGGEDEDSNNGVAAVAAHKSGVEQSHAGKEVAEDGDFEHQSHNEHCEEECVEIGL